MGVWLTIMHRQDGDSRADGLVHLSWLPCPSALLHDQVEPVAGSGAALTVFVDGVSSDHRGYSIELTFANADGLPLADAWRFDSGGCQDYQNFTFWAGQPAYPTGCGSMMREANYDSLFRYGRFVYDPMSGRGRALLDVRYWPPVTAPDPSVKKYLGFVTMNFSGTTVGPSQGGLCGGIERGVCIWASGGGYVRTDGEFVPWDLAGASVTAGIEATPTFDCLGVPASRATWGELKAIYRE